MEQLDRRGPGATARRRPAASIKDSDTRIIMADVIDASRRCGHRRFLGAVV